MEEEMEEYFDVLDEEGNFTGTTKSKSEVHTKKMKVITVCGSLRFMKEMMEIGEKMELQGNCMLMPIYPTNPDKDAYTEEEVIMLDKMHKEKIKLSDAILVVNVNNYIGSSTKSEIEYAKSLNKEILYYAEM